MSNFQFQGLSFLLPSYAHVPKELKIFTPTIFVSRVVRFASKYSYRLFEKKTAKKWMAIILWAYWGALHCLTQHVRGKIIAQITKIVADFAILRTSKDDIKFFKIFFVKNFQPSHKNVLRLSRIVVSKLFSTAWTLTFSLYADITYFSIVKKIHANELFYQGSKFDYQIIWFIRHVLSLCVMLAILSVIFAIVSKTQCILSRALAFSRLFSAKGSQRSCN